MESIVYRREKGTLPRPCIVVGGRPNVSDGTHRIFVTKKKKVEGHSLRFATGQTTRPSDRADFGLFSVHLCPTQAKGGLEWDTRLGCLCGKCREK